MARAKALDKLHNFRFHVVVRGFGPNTAPVLGTLTNGGQVTAGFMSCSAPEVTEEAVDYREGHFIYAQKFVGLPTVSDITLARGVALAEGTLWAWVKDVIEAGNEYRADVDIYHLHRDMKPTTASPAPMPIDTNSTGMIKYECLNAFPTSFKTSGDLDASSSDVSVQELTMAIESFDVVNPNVP